MMVYNTQLCQRDMKAQIGLSNMQPLSNQMFRLFNANT